jgi:hypothetical protein
LIKGLVFEALYSFLMHSMNHLNGRAAGIGNPGDSTKVLRKYRASDETILLLIASRSIQTKGEIGGHP